MRTKPTERIVRGTVASSGVGTGLGFTAAKQALGSFGVTFIPPFAGPPTVVVAPAQAGGVIADVGPGVTAGTFGVATYASNTAAAGDYPFHFIAVGPDRT